MKRTNDVTQAEVELLKTMYNSGCEISEICSTLDISKKTFYTIRNKYNIPANRHVYNLNKTKESYAEFEKVFIHDSVYNDHINYDDSIQRRLDYSLNEEYFDRIDNQNKAYFLGLLLADGWVSNNCLSINLQERDKHILESFSKELVCNKPLKKLEYSKKNPNFSDQYSFSISSKHMINSLAYYNVVEQKSLSLEFPTNLEFNLYRHMLRGYIDGDGTILKSTYDKRVSLVSTESFCHHAKLLIENYLDINCSILCCHDKTKPTRTLQIRGGNQCSKLLNWIYDDANYYLFRKHDIFIEYYK